MFQFLQDIERFQSVDDCFNIIISLSQADSVKDLIWESQQHPFGTFIMIAIVVVTFMSITQIFVAVITIGFQKTKEAFRIAAEEKAEKIEKSNELTLKNLNKFDYQLRLKKQLLQELQLLFQRDIFNEPRGAFENRDLRIDSIDTNLIFKRNITIPENSRHKISNLQSNKSKTRLFLAKDDNFTENDRKINMRQDTEGHLNQTNQMEKYISVFRNLCLELVVQSYFNFDLLNKFFDEFQTFKLKNQFSFVQIIALWDICEDYLQKLKQLEMRLMRLENKINIQ